VHDFVYIMAEENKRLVAYVDDLYEDMRENNTVSVRWFHKVDEVGASIILPPDVTEREIFFSLCFQDLSVECIDGLACVFNPAHFDQFHAAVRPNHRLYPYMCRRMIDNDDIKAFDVTQLQGYWSQEALRSMFSPTSLKLRLKISTGKKMKRDAVGVDEKNASVKSASGKWLPLPGQLVEVLSQDSGIRGCWFRGIILRKHQDRIKVQYLDIQDADGTGKLEVY
jgi:Agenet domain